MKKGKSIMLQGTASSVGKSLMTAALCRILTDDGFKVVPFKSQNMALNSYVTEEGLEMGRAQVMQAEACRVKPSVTMNPILLKPSAEKTAQVIVNGKVYKNMTAYEYHQYKPQLKHMLKGVFENLLEGNDFVVIEGAGSPAEINLRENDIVNMGMAEIADCPVILVGDIDRGGVFASLYGTIMLLEEEERRRIKGIIINKFRGDVKILEPGLKMLEDLVGIPVIGVVPYGDFNIEDEDSVTHRFKRQYENREGVNIDVIKLPFMSNFTDFHVFEAFHNVTVRYVTDRDEMNKPDVLIIPGSKNTMADLKYLRESGLEEKILKAHHEGSIIIGICGGYQMLGNKLMDADGHQGSIAEMDGLGLLDIETVFEKEKITQQVTGCMFKNLPFVDDASKTIVKGYEIHMGRTKIGANVNPFIKINYRQGIEVSEYDGAISKDERVFGTYIHGIFDELSFTNSLIHHIMKKKNLEPRTEGEKIHSYQDFKEREYNKLADTFRSSVDIKKIYEILGESI